MMFKRIVLTTVLYFIFSLICYFLIYYTKYSIDSIKLYSYIASIILVYIGAYWFSKWITTNNNKEK